jgi:hypothetical protein
MKQVSAQKYKVENCPRYSDITNLKNSCHFIFHGLQLSILTFYFYSFSHKIYTLMAKYFFLSFLVQ